VTEENDIEYELPDFSVIKIPARVRMGVPELFFNPQHNGLTCKSMTDLTWNSVQSCDLDVRKSLSSNIILSGGSTLYSGLASRLKSEIECLAPVGADIRIKAPEDRQFAVWNGASTLATMPGFSSNWIT
jgi:actin